MSKIYPGAFYSVHVYCSKLYLRRYTSTRYRYFPGHPIVSIVWEVVMLHTVMCTGIQQKRKAIYSCNRQDCTSGSESHLCTDVQLRLCCHINDDVDESLAVSNAQCSQAAHPCSSMTAKLFLA